MQDPTIEQLMAGIQSKKGLSREKLLEKIAYFRNSRSTIDIELNRLAVYAEDYNEVWAAKNTYNFGTTEALQNRTKSQCKRWSEMLELTSPRYRASAASPGKEQTVYKASYLTKTSYELDLWGPASYGTLIYELKEELDFIVDHMEDGEHLCKDVIKQEAAIDQDPEYKKELFERQYRAEFERSSETIERYCKEGFVNTSSPLYQRMLTFENRDDFINNDFHKRSSSQFSDFVITDATVKLQEREISPIERRLLGDDFEKICRVRSALEHADELLGVKPGGQFEPLDIIECIRWCDVLPSTKQHKDNEHEFYEKYMKLMYKGTHTWPAWPTVFNHRKSLGDTAVQRRLDAQSFNKKFQLICGNKASTTSTIIEKGEKN